MEEIKFEWDLFFIEKIIEKIEKISIEKGFSKRMDIETQMDRRIVEFAKEEEGFLIYVDLEEGGRAIFNLKGEKGIEIFYESVEELFKEVEEKFKEILKRRK
ncbi:MAG: hypothetical protein ABIM49_06065 [candidate division WOR-3 bacterium]|uniref:Uncharacterized protein n=1 Tax=candidate division WOR-3 bacterium TaxID=2052148 RepID=A0A7V3ZTD1_UNCW3